MELDILLRPFTYLVDPKQRVFFLYLFSAFFIATIFYGVKEKSFNLKNILGKVFPTDIYFHHSAKLDYLYFIISKTVIYFFIGGLSLSIDFISIIHFFGLDLPQYAVEKSAVIVWLYTIAILIVTDFAIFIAHYFQHKSKFFWEFHKVHHTAAVMTPMTVYRMHPVSNMLTFFFTLTLISGFDTLLLYSFNVDSFYQTWFGLNPVFVIFYVVGYNLRHSHVPIRFPNFLENIFISPYQHQIHHSDSPLHIDKNMGFMLAIWDRAFGTLVKSSEINDKINFGLADKEMQSRYNSVVDLLFLPFVRVLKHRRQSIFIGFCLIAIVFPYEMIVYFNNEENVLVEKMTHTEFQKRLDKGYKAMIIPTGGFEQNGPHLTFNKHQIVIKHTSQEVAKRLGRTLVAPVIAFVPEGNVQIKEGHMAFAGTISVENETYTDLLYQTAESFVVHGVNRIFYLGDSVGNQKGQKIACERLMLKYPYLKCLSVDSYYNSGQYEFLKSKGYKIEEIGYHAGIKGTSEVLYVAPDQVKMKELHKNVKHQGFSGNPTLANKKLGKGLLDLKINKAVQEIEAYLKK